MDILKNYINTFEYKGRESLQYILLAIAQRHKKIDGCLNEMLKHPQVGKDCILKLCLKKGAEQIQEHGYWIDPITQQPRKL